MTPAATRKRIPGMPGGRGAEQWSVLRAHPGTSQSHEIVAAGELVPGVAWGDTRISWRLRSPSAAATGARPQSPLAQINKSLATRERAAVWRSKGDAGG